MVKLMVCLCAVLLCCTPKPKGTFVPFETVQTHRWYHFYQDNRLDSAWVYVSKRLQEHPDELPTLCYAAELLRRQQHYRAADSLADRALRLDSVNSFALQVKGQLRNAQYDTKNPLVHAGSARMFYNRAVAADSTNGNVWEVLWVQALVHGDTALESRVLRSLHTGAFYTPAARAYARWLLSSLPPNAILLTNGDMDTYPLRVAQKMESFRDDVTVVNVSLLNLKSYYTSLVEYHRLPPAVKTRALPSIDHRYVDGAVVTIAHQIIEHWLMQISAGTLKRPLCVATTVENGALPRATHSFWWMRGNFFHLVKGGSAREIDFETVERALNGIDGALFSGRFIGQRVTSPLMLAGRSGSRIDATITKIGIATALEYLGKKNAKRALAVLERVDRYLDDVDRDTKRMKDKVEKVRAKIRASASS